MTASAETKIKEPAVCGLVVAIVRSSDPNLLRPFLLTVRDGTRGTSFTRVAGFSHEATAMPRARTKVRRLGGKQKDELLGGTSK